MGTSFAAQLLSTDVEPEEKLWRGVLCNAIEDAGQKSQERKPSIYKCEAHAWIMSNVTDFHTVCYYAGFEPEHVKERYKKAIMEGLQRLLLERFVSDADGREDHMFDSLPT